MHLLQKESWASRRRDLLNLRLKTNMQHRKSYHSAKGRADERDKIKNDKSETSWKLYGCEVFPLWPRAPCEKPVWWVFLSCLQVESHWSTFSFCSAAIWFKSLKALLCIQVRLQKTANERRRKIYDCNEIFQFVSVSNRFALICMKQNFQHVYHYCYA